MEYIVECNIIRRIRKALLDYKLHSSYTSELINGSSRITNINIPRTSSLYVIINNEEVPLFANSNGNETNIEVV